MANSATSGAFYQRWLPLALVAVAFLITGCPHNEYIVEMKPQGDHLERSMVYYRADGTNKDTGEPNYSDFDTNELAMIESCYPPGNRVNDGKRLTAWGDFTNALPGDVGGTGAYTNLTTSLGEAGFYVERFRGKDDLAGLVEQRFEAADRLTDMMLGWSNRELRHEHGYRQLRGFLNGDFRRDVRNLGEYWWQGQTIKNYQTNADEEFMVRFGQYLAERGYFSVAEIPRLFNDWSDADDRALLGRIQRLVARKMGVPDSAPIPPALAFLADDDSLKKSLDQYLVTTKEYKTRYKQWKLASQHDPKLKAPEPSEVMDDALLGLIQWEVNPDSADRLTVKLTLPDAPTHSNGRWEETSRQEVWASAILDRTNASFAPFLFYANWVEVNESYQKDHLGKVVLTGDDLTQYCCWRNALAREQGAEWDRFLSQLQPGPTTQLTNQIAHFRFSDETKAATNSPSEFGRTMLESVLK